ncbi:hypothetical protein QYE76_045563 [Lolium multiflorum]|uniref:Transposase (putative) gypsy type domain-containing protein n=1 Tax=Lolium multiflorum TaxID=4521 RepID=A0AAD8TL92_LOLMU|nr:hypothetical protein QYE76_045563 [Lolium multiflorum]
MATTDLGSAEWERSKISAQDINLLKKMGFSKKENSLRFPKEESYPRPPIEYRVSFVDHLIRGLSPPIHEFLRGLLFVDGLQLHQLTPNSILHVSIFITLCECFLGANLIGLCGSVSSASAVMAPTTSPTTLAALSSVFDVEYFDVKFPDCPRTTPFSLLFLLFLRVEKLKTVPLSMMTTKVPRALKVKSRVLTNPASSEKSESEATAPHSLPPAVSPRNKRKMDEIEDSGTSKAEEAGPSDRKAAFNPYDDALVSFGDEEEVQAIDATARTSTSRTLVVSEVQADGEEYSPPQQNTEQPTPPASPRVPSPKRSRVESITEPTLQLGGSTTPLLDDPLIKEFIRFGAQFVGYRDHANKAEENLAEANKRADALAQKLEQIEKARKKAEADAKKAKEDAEKAKADAAGVEDLRKRLHDVETALSDKVTEQTAREEKILSRLQSQSRRFVRRTHQEYEVDGPEGDELLDALTLLEIHGDEACEGLADAEAGLSKLFPYFFSKKEEPNTFTALAKSFNVPEDLGLKLRQEGLKIGVEGTIALIADSQQNVDWTKVGDIGEMETKKWQSLIRAAKPPSKPILAFLGVKPTPAPSASKPEVK